MSTALPRVITEHIAAINASDLEAAAATFAEDAYVTAQGEARGLEAVRSLLKKEFIDDHVTLDVREVIDHHGDFIVRTTYDGTYDKTDLPDPLIMTNYFALRGDKIVTLAVIFIRPSETEKSDSLP